MIALYVVLDGRNFVNFKDGINAMLVGLKLDSGGFRTSEEFEERK